MRLELLPKLMIKKVLYGFTFQRLFLKKRLFSAFSSHKFLFQSYFFQESKATRWGVAADWPREAMECEALTAAWGTWGRHEGDFPTHSSLP